MGTKVDNIRQGRAPLTPPLPGPWQMNGYDEHPFKVILDYGLTRPPSKR